MDVIADARCLHPPVVRAGSPPLRVVGMLIVAVTCALGSCKSPSFSSFDTDERVTGALFPTFRTSLDLSRESEEQEHGSGGSSLEFQATGVDERFRSADPALGEVDLSLVELGVAYRPGWRLGERVRLDPTVGVLYRSSRFESRGTLGEEQSDAAVRPTLGLLFRWEPVDRLELSARADTNMFLDAELRTEVALGYAVAEQVQLQVGYRWWHVEFEDLRAGDVDVRLEGILFGVALRF